MILLTGNANKPLAEKTAKHLNQPLGRALISSFSDQESHIEISDKLHGLDVFILQSTSTPANHHLMELGLMIDAARRAFANKITAVIPYFGYARQDKRTGSTQIPISAKVCADFLTAVGANNLLTLDLHSDQLQGFFSIPVENLSSAKLFIEDIAKRNYQNPVIVSPDAGGVERARAFAKQLNEAELAIIDKRRPHPNEIEVMNLIGNVKNRNCIIVDDLVDTANTLCLTAKTLKDHGAKSVIAYSTHPVLSGKAIPTIETSLLDKLLVTDTIPLNPAAQACSRIEVLSVAPMLAKAITHLYTKKLI